MSSEINAEKQVLMRKNQLPSPFEIVAHEEESVLDYQMKFIFEEYKMVQSEIAELSKKSQNCRNWTITLWAGSIALFINPAGANSPEYIVVSTIFPLMFWLQDTRFTQIQRAFIFRSKKITDFFAGTGLEQSKAAGKIVDFEVSGFRKSTQVELFDDPELKNFNGFWKVLFFQTKTSFYPVFAGSSVLLHLFFNYHSEISASIRSFLT